MKNRASIETNAMFPKARDSGTWDGRKSRQCRAMAGGGRILRQTRSRVEKW